MRSKSNAPGYDVESGGGDAYLVNDTVHSFTWHSVSVTVRDKATKADIKILSDVNGSVKAGEYLSPVQDDDEDCTSQKIRPPNLTDISQR